MAAKTKSKKKAPLVITIRKAGRGWDVSYPKKHIDAHASWDGFGWILDVFDSRKKKNSHMGTIGVGDQPGSPDWSTIITELL